LPCDFTPNLKNKSSYCLFYPENRAIAISAMMILSATGLQAAGGGHAAADGLSSTAFSGFSEWPMVQATPV
jgi:hypothetical protein